MQESVRTAAGQIAASSVVAAKQLPLRTPPAVALSADFQPSSVGDAPRLFGPHGEDFHRVARLSSAALVYSVDKQRESLPARLLYGWERQRLSEMHERRQQHRQQDRSCPHCQLLHETLYTPAKKPPVAVVNHSAHVQLEFDPEMNISEARIENFQVIVPSTVAQQILHFSHPLRWADPPGTLFQRCFPVAEDGTRPSRLRGAPDTLEKAWTQEPRKFIFEDVSWPINEDLSTAAENIIEIRDFQESAGFLSYNYRLRRCLRTNFGVAWEPSGLDVDGGHYEAFAVPLADLTSDLRSGKTLSGNRSSGPGHRVTELVTRLKKRDIWQLKAFYQRDGYEDLYNGTFVEHSRPRKAATPYREPGLRAGAAEQNQQQAEQATPAEIARTFNFVNDQLKSEWDGLTPFSLVNISASKRLHYTRPENSPPELWHVLTWIAPAVLFTFLNNAIALAPHVLVDALVKARNGGVPHGSKQSAGSTARPARGTRR